MATLAVYVNPKSAADAIVGWREDTGEASREAVKPELVVKLTAAPTDGKANSALIKLLAKKLGIPKSAITIKSGQSSRHKLLAIAMEQAALDRILR